MNDRFALAAALLIGAGSLLAYRVRSTGAGSSASAPEKLPHAWPPVLGQPYPDLELQDHTGKRVRLSQWKGKVIVVEPIGTSCPGCQAYAGGPFKGGTPQPNLTSFEDLLVESGVRWRDEPDLIYVSLLLYNQAVSGPPSQAEAKAWAETYRLDKQRNAVVLFGDQRYINKASYDLIPGFHVIDRQFVLRGDATGHHPKEYASDALAKAAKLLR